MTKYYVYDVFSDTPFGGNQLAVIPNAAGLLEADLQRIAREFNYSETTFVFPPVSSKHTAKVRIFTPTMEVPFAGHPVIGTACALAADGAGSELTLELGIGPLTCTVDGGSSSFVMDAPLEIIAEPDPALVAAALGLQTHDLRFDTHPPILGSLGLAFTLSEVKDRATLARIQTDVAAFRTGREAHPSSLDFAQFAYARDGQTIHARMFAPLDNIPEDPATGSASATLAALLSKISNQNVALHIEQGADMGRPSQIYVTTVGKNITVQGHACRIMQGEIVHNTST